MTQLGAQFRLIQKRLISKFKVKNPTSLSGLELLLNDTFDEIMNTTNTLQISIEELKKSQIDLSCVLNLVLNLIRIKGIPSDALQQIEAAFDPVIEDIDGQVRIILYSLSLLSLLFMNYNRIGKIQLMHQCVTY